MPTTLRTYQKPSALKRRLDQFHLVGRRVVQMDIFDDCGSCKFYGSIQSVKRQMGNHPVPICFETDGDLIFTFDDGTFLLITARDNLAYQVEFGEADNSRHPPSKRASGAEIAFSHVLGHLVSDVEVLAEKSAKDSYGDWIDEKNHRKFLLIKWLVLKFDNGYSIKMGTSLDYAWLELEGPDGKTTSQSFSAAWKSILRFRGIDSCTPQPGTP